jgi:hypothetical protein
MVNLKRLVIAAVLAASATAVAGCDESLPDFAGPSPNLEPTFSSIQSEIFARRDLADRPACLECHTSQGRTPTGGMDLSADAYDNLVGFPSRGRPEVLRVVPGDPEASYLLHKLEGRSGIVGARMPQRGPYLTDNQIFIIRRWIERGAPRD